MPKLSKKEQMEKRIADLEKKLKLMELDAEIKQIEEADKNLRKAQQQLAEMYRKMGKKVPDDLLKSMGLKPKSIIDWLKRKHNITFSGEDWTPEQLDKAVNSTIEELLDKVYELKVISPRSRIVGKPEKLERIRKLAGADKEQALWDYTEPNGLTTIRTYLSRKSTKPTKKTRDYKGYVWNGKGYVLCRHYPFTIWEIKASLLSQYMDFLESYALKALQVENNLVIDFDANYKVNRKKRNWYR